MTARPPRSRGLRTYLSLVKFEHTLFALPFAYAGMLLAARGWPGWSVFGLVTLAMVGARTAAMAANRVIDARIDAANPRTQDREIPSGRLSRWDGVVLMVVGLIALSIAGALLNPLTLALLPVAVIALVVYPYLKRVTWWCHVWLGLTIGAAAAGGWIAVTGSFHPTAVALWLAVASWVAGFDVIYAVLDVAIDRAQGLNSMPARFGVSRALTISAVMHALTFLALVFVWRTERLGWAYGGAVILTGIVLLYQQREVRQHTVADVLRSFNANLVVGMLFLLGVVVDLMVVR